MRYCAILIRLQLLAGLMLATSGRAVAQGFMVKPMTVEVAGFAGKPLTIPIEVRNTSSQAATEVETTLVELGQGQNGSWEIRGDGDKVANPRSALNWLRRTPEQLTLPAMAAASVTLRADPPRTARGTYYAGVVVRRPAPEGTGVRLVLQFLVPVVINIQGPPARESFGLAGLELGFDKNRPPSGITYAAFAVKNDGETVGKIGAEATVLWRGPRTWQRVLSRVFDERSVLPGLTVIFAKDLERQLPAGAYRLQIALKVGGKVRSRLEKDVDFVGDPNTKSLAIDVPLQLDPANLVVKAGAGSRRFGMLTLRNPSEETVKVKCSVAAPPGLEGVALGPIDGKEFIAASWVTLEPTEFELRGGSSKNVRVTVSVPTAGKQRPRAFADLRVDVMHLDGQSAGRAYSRVTVEHPQATPKPQGYVGAPALAQQDGDRYAVSARFENHGEALLVPQLVARVITPAQNQVREVSLDAAAKEMLPLAAQLGSGVLDFAGVEPGGYYLVAVMRYGDLAAYSQLPIKVEIIDNHRVVTVVEQTEAAPAPAADAPKAPAAPAVGAPAAP